MPIIRRSRAGAGTAIAALALFVPATAAAAGGFPLPVEDSPSGVLAPAADARYLTVSIAGRTAVLAQSTSSGRVTSRSDLRGRFGVPVVAFDSTAGGISADGATLVLVRARNGVPRRQTEFAVMAVKPRLRRRQTVRLPGDFSFDALSPDGRSLYLVNYLSPSDPTKYRVRVYDLTKRRLDPRAVVDPRESPDEMNGIPVTRVAGTGGRWAYTLYDGAGKHPFIHALDTVGRKAVCIDLEGAPFAAGTNAYELRLALAGHGSRLDMRRKGALVATVDTATFRVRTGAAALAAAGAVVNDPAGPSLLWPGVGLALLAAGLLARRIARRQDRPRPQEDLATSEFGG
ncbi:MAG TPA: hypothetical protein VGO80_05550 [Solirubrobacteraceae bacterium]|jgi:hypothetical protein|nr:hypothetical protein [Solirubrobacteraceae bacterium]